MCISRILQQLSVSNLMANMPVPSIASKLQTSSNGELQQHQITTITTTTTTTTTTTNTTTTSSGCASQHREYGETFTTVCTQCKKVLVPSLVRSQGISIRLSSEENDTWVELDDAAPQHSSCLSHGLCRSCFENMDADLSLSPLSLRPPSSRRGILCKSLSSPHLSRPLPPPPSAPKVLVVDDNKLQRQIHKRMVEQEGFECDLALTGEQAIEMIKKEKYCLVLMDLVMAPLDGWTTSRQIRSTSSTSSLSPSPSSSSYPSPSSPRIVAVTGLNVDEKLHRECLEAGMDDVVQKPVSPAILNKVLGKYTKQGKEINR